MPSPRHWRMQRPTESNLGASQRFVSFFFFVFSLSTVSTSIGFFVKVHDRERWKSRQTQDQQELQEGKFSYVSYNIFLIQFFLGFFGF
jgi:hypothetical protein